tara:strand:+ start:1531 stop:2571 length:1041 start_codon:yes stop_codon:yes gene_type:complete
MAYISFKPSAFFNTVLYTGNGGTNAITGVGFQPNMIWSKERSGSRNHYLVDSVRGTGEELRPNSTNHSAGDGSLMSSFDSDGFTLGSSNSMNSNSATFVAWNWKGGTTSGITTNGSTVITPSAYSFNATSGVAILKYTGNGNTTTKVAHGLGAAPKWMLIKKTSASGDNWTVYHIASGNDTSLQLDNDGGTSGGSDRFYDVTPDTVNFTLGDHTSVNASGATYMAYCFAEKPGFSRFGKFKGNGSAHGPFIYTGFKPAWVMVKRLSSGYDWAMKDNKRSPINEVTTEVYADDTAGDTAGGAIDFVSNGFKLRNNTGTWNGSDISYAYMVFAEEPFVASNGDPATAR